MTRLYPIEQKSGFRTCRGRKYTLQKLIKLKRSISTKEIRLPKCEVWGWKQQMTKVDRKRLLRTYKKYIELIPSRYPQARNHFKLLWSSEKQYLAFKPKQVKIGIVHESSIYVDKWTAHRLRTNIHKLRKVDKYLAIIASKLPSAKYHVRHHYDIFYGALDYAFGKASKAEQHGTPMFRMHLAQLAGLSPYAGAKTYHSSTIQYLWYSLHILIKLMLQGVWIMDVSAEPIYMSSYYTGGCNATSFSDRGEYITKVEKNRFEPQWKLFELAISFDMYHEQIILSEGVEKLIVVGITTSKAIGEDRYNRLRVESNNACEILNPGIPSIAAQQSRLERLNWSQYIYFIINNDTTQAEICRLRAILARRLWTLQLQYKKETNKSVKLQQQIQELEELLTPEKDWEKKADEIKVKQELKKNYSKIRKETIQMISDNKIFGLCAEDFTTNNTFTDDKSNDSWDDEDYSFTTTNRHKQKNTDSEDSSENEEMKVDEDKLTKIIRIWDKRCYGDLFPIFDRDAHSITIPKMNEPFGGDDYYNMEFQNIDSLENDIQLNEPQLIEEKDQYLEDYTMDRFVSSKQSFSQHELLIASEFDMKFQNIQEQLFQYSWDKVILCNYITQVANIAIISFKSSKDKTKWLLSRIHEHVKNVEDILIQIMTPNFKHLTIWGPKNIMNRLYYNIPRRSGINVQWQEQCVKRLGIYPAKDIVVRRKEIKALLFKWHARKKIDKVK